MAEVRDITLGERVFAIPPLVWKHNVVIYPLCAALTNGGFIERIAITKSIDVDADTFAALGELVLRTCQAAEPEFTQDEFDELLITPQQLFDAFLVARFQTGHWVPAAPKTGEDGDEPGEEPGAQPPTSTSTESSPARSATSGKRRSSGKTH